MRQFDVELWPEAKGVHDAGCEGTLEFVRDQHAEIRRSARNLLELTSRWAEGDYAAQDQVARGLLDLAVADASINRYEEQHPFACLGSSLPGAFIWGRHSMDTPGQSAPSKRTSADS
jgi:hypothetical protein